MNKRIPKNGLTIADYKIIADFQREMNEKVIPKIVKAVRRRQILASKSKHWFIGRSLCQSHS